MRECLVTFVRAPLQHVITCVLKLSDWENASSDTCCNCLTFLHCVFHQMHPQIAYLRECVVALAALFCNLFPNAIRLFPLGRTWKHIRKIMMHEAGCIEIFSRNMAFDKLFSSAASCDFSTQAVLITREPQFIQVGSNLIVFPPRWWPYMLAQVWSWSGNLPKYFTLKIILSINCTFRTDSQTMFQCMAKRS